MSDGLLAVHGSAYGTNGCREMFCPLVRFRRKADVPSSPVAALAHSRFWHSADMPAVAFDVRFFSNRPFRVKRFQTIHDCGVNVARGLALLSGLL
jgi:hypothetical protein